MAQVILGHDVSGCFGTSLAPKTGPLKYPVTKDALSLALCFSGTGNGWSGYARRPTWNHGRRIESVSFDARISGFAAQ